MPTYSAEEKARLVAAWAATPWGQKGLLAEREGFPLNRLSDNVKRWSARELAAKCARPACSNPTGPGQDYCSRGCAGTVRRTPDDLSTPLSRFLERKRAELHLNRADFARLMGVSPQRLTNWLKGRSSPQAATYERIRQLFPDAPSSSPSLGAVERRHFLADSPGALELHDHVAWYGDGRRSLNRLAVHLFTIGARRGERMMFVVEDPDPGRLGGLPDLDGLLARGDLQLAAVGDVYQGGSQFDPAEQLAIFGEALDAALDQGYRGLRVVAENTPLVTGSHADVERWLAWEQLTDDFQAARPVLGVCFFDTTRIPPARLRDLASIHPVISPTEDDPEFRIFQDRGVIRVTGSLDAFSVERLRRVLSTTPSRGNLVIDLGHADFVDHRALHVLGQQGGPDTHVEIRNASPVLRRLWGIFEDQAAGEAGADPYDRTGDTLGQRGSPMRA